jgi:ferredoxin
MMNVDASLCMRCGACVSACPFDAIEATDGSVKSNERCTECGICVKICPMGAIEVARKKV